MTTICRSRMRTTLRGDALVQGPPRTSSQPTTLRDCIAQLAKEWEDAAAVMQADGDIGSAIEWRAFAAALREALQRP